MTCFLLWLVEAAEESLEKESLVDSLKTQLDALRATLDATVDENTNVQARILSLERDIESLNEERTATAHCFEAQVQLLNDELSTTKRKVDSFPVLLIEPVDY